MKLILCECASVYNDSAQMECYSFNFPNYTHFPCKKIVYYSAVYFIFIELFTLNI